MLIAVLIVALGLAVFLAFVASKPGSFRLERSTQIAAAPAQIRPLIEDFRRWPEWSPWENLDPNMKRTLSGPESGVGAVYEWAGAGKAGEGRMEILGSTPEVTSIDLQFLKPFKAKNLAEFTYRPQDGGTLLVWSMSGPQPFIGKLMHTVFNMDKLVGKDFESGLAALKTKAEA